jgi:hypothetical protein
MQAAKQDASRAGKDAGSCGGVDAGRDPDMSVAWTGLRWCFHRTPARPASGRFDGGNPARCLSFQEYALRNWYSGDGDEVYNEWYLA